MLPRDSAARTYRTQVKPAIQQQTPLTAVNSHAPLDGGPRAQQPPQPHQIAAGPRPPYGPVPRHAFFGRPPAPGQGPPRFPPPRPPPAGYGPAPQGFPLGRPPFAPTGIDPRLLRPRQPAPQQQAVPYRQTSLAHTGMAEVELAGPPGALEQRRASPAEEAERGAPVNEADQQSRARSAMAMSVDAAKTPGGARNSRSAGPTAGGGGGGGGGSGIQGPVEGRGKAPCTPSVGPTVSGGDSGIRGLEGGRGKAPCTPSTGPTAGDGDSGRQGPDEGCGKAPCTPSASPAQPAPLGAELTGPRATNGASADRASSGRAGAPPRARPDVEESIRSSKPDAENDSGVDETTQRREAPKSNGVSSRTPSKTRDADKRSAAGSPIKSPNKSIKSLPRTPDAAPPTAEKKKVPMNKVQVGAAPSPNLKAVRSKIGSLENATHKPGGGKIKIENRKLDFSSAQPKIAAKNDKYTPSGGDKKIEQVKLQWNAKPKIGSLENATYKPGGGNKKIETVKLDFKDKAKSRVGSKENAKHVPGGGSVKSSATSPKTPQDNNVNIESQKLEFKAESKVGSMDNMKHRPGGGDKKIFDDKSYLRQTSSNVGSVSGSGSQMVSSRPNSLVGLSSSDKRSTFDAPQPPPTTPTRSRNSISPSVAIRPGSVQVGFDKTPETLTASKKSLPGSPRKNKSKRELQLPTLSPSNSNYPAITETHKSKQTKITLPNLQK
ncbi:microtubule-associated protein tau isoform X2 [Phymastichus coffea]|uniref:microtubule-associated protein tau isoform X2 n=1 Tax=Phymastichus coffea TaxID=108790 RepID=UPI00273B3A62|nr:microtubule-associated protein tau isoform X2 [Phymastichus coffea]